MNKLIYKREDDDLYELTEEGLKAYSLIMIFETHLTPKSEYGGI